jgi:hypothetical protein
MRTLTKLDYAINALLAGAPAPNESEEEARDACERLKLIQARVKIEYGDAGPQDIATVRGFLDSQRRQILEFFHPE